MAIYETPETIRLGEIASLAIKSAMHAHEVVNANPTNENFRASFDATDDALLKSAEYEEASAADYLVAVSPAEEAKVKWTRAHSHLRNLELIQAIKKEVVPELQEMNDKLAVLSEIAATLSHIEVNTMSF